MVKITISIEQTNTEALSIATHCDNIDSTPHERMAAGLIQSLIETHFETPPETPFTGKFN